LTTCPYFANIVELGRIAGKYGRSPDRFPFPIAPIRTLEVGIYSVGVILGTVGATISFGRKDPAKIRIEPHSFICADINIEIHANGRVKVDACVARTPEVAEFERPTGKGVMFSFEHGRLELQAAVNKVGPKTLEYFNALTIDALKAFKELYPAWDLGLPTAEVLVDFSKLPSTEGHPGITAGE
jgi:hypothetical protein